MTVTELHKAIIVMRVI